MKKVIALILLLCLCFACMSCSKEDNSQQPDSSAAGQTAAPNPVQEAQPAPESSRNELAGDWIFDAKTGSDSTSGIFQTWALYGKWSETMSLLFNDDGTGSAFAYVQVASETYNPSFTYTIDSDAKKVTITLEDGSSVEADYEVQGNALVLSANGMKIRFLK